MWLINLLCGLRQDKSVKSIYDYGLGEIEKKHYFSSVKQEMYGI